MNSRRILGIILSVVGVVLLIMGLDATDSFSDRMSRFFTGNFTDATVWYLVVGLTLAIAGLSLLFAGGRRGRI